MHILLFSRCQTSYFRASYPWLGVPDISKPYKRTYSTSVVNYSIGISKFRSWKESFVEIHKGWSDRGYYHPPILESPTLARGEGSTYVFKVRFFHLICVLTLPDCSVNLRKIAAAFPSLLHFICALILELLYSALSLLISYRVRVLLCVII